MLSDLHGVQDAVVSLTGELRSSPQCLAKGFGDADLRDACMRARALELMVEQQTHQWCRLAQPCGGRCLPDGLCCENAHGAMHPGPRQCDGHTTVGLAPCAHSNRNLQQLERYRACYRWQTARSRR